MFLLIVSVLIVSLIYLNVIKPIFYWRKSGIFHVPLWKEVSQTLFSNKSFFETTTDEYKQFPDRRYYGSYQFFKPSLFVRDLELIKRITVKDFEHFSDHLNFVSEKADPILGLNLFNLKGEKWKDMRATLSPAFTSSKMRSMYTLIQESAAHFVDFFFVNDDEVIELEMKNVFSRYTNDVIANCAFGIKCDSLKEKTNQFYTMGEALTVPKGTNALRGLVAAFFPSLFEFLRIPVISSRITEFFRNIITQAISYREKEKIVRPDLIHLLMEARKGRLKHEDENHSSEYHKLDYTYDPSFAKVEESDLGKSSRRMELTDDVLTAQAMVFFFAGFDTSSTLLTFLCYELALNPDIQANLQERIDKVVPDISGMVTYTEILNMRYLDQVVSETLRKYPPGFILNRICTKDYKIEAQKDNESDFVVEQGCLITVPVAGIHMDPDYFPEPQRFDPDRFSDKNKEKIVPGSYMPFGSGPRNCIGSRFALLEAKVLIVSLLTKFDIVPVKRTCIPLKLAKTLNLNVKGGLWLGFKNRSKLRY